MLPLLAVVFIVLAVWFDWRKSKLEPFDWLIIRASLIYARLWHRCKSNRPAPFPLDRGCLVASNHTCSADPMFILAACRYPIGFVVAQEHYEIHAFFRWVLDGIASVPVRRGGHDALALRRSLRTLARGRVLCLFPEGGLSGVGLGRRGRLRPGIGYLALKTRLPVYPVHISGGPRTDELLPSWVYFTPRAARVDFGPPIDLSAFYDRPLSRKVIDEATQLIMQRVEECGKRRSPADGDRP